MGHFAFGSTVDVSQPLGAKKHWRMDVQLIYMSSRHKRLVTVPVGFQTDFASVPWFFRRLLPRTGEYNAAAIVHDYLYRCAGVPRDVADDIFLEAMEDLDVPLWKRQLMYAAVRIGGSGAYGKPDFICRSGRGGVSATGKNGVLSG